MRSACFTGHRKIAVDTVTLETHLYNELEKAITENGVSNFYAGGAVGSDELAARTVLKLREIYPHMKLDLILPCSNEEQTEKWSEEEKTGFYRILRLADPVEYTSEHYYNGCMKKRNARLVECADICFCYWNANRDRSGTAQTVRMAQKKNIAIVNLYEMI